MTALRWTLGLIIVFLGGGFVVLSIVAGGFRRSFGASDVNPLVTILPLAAMALLLAALVLPAHRTLLHIAAGAAVVLVGFCLWFLIKESGTVMWWGLAYLAAWLVFYWGAAWRQPTARTLTPSTLSYPVLLVNENTIAEVCLDAGELTLRPENTDHIIEQRFHVVDATGRRYRIENFRAAEARPSTLSRVFDASVYNVKRFKVAFELRPDGTLTRDEVLTQLRDREWAMPASTSPLAELFVAYRTDRFREYGSSRDRMPDAARPKSALP